MKKKLALLLAISMLASMAVPAAAADPDKGKVVIGEGDVKNAIINYQIPIKLNFALDAFQKIDTASESQIWSTDFPIINKSDVPLQAVVKTYIVDPTSTDADGGLKPPTKTTVVTSPSDVNQTEIDVATAQAYVEVVPALTIDAKADTVYEASKESAVVFDSTYTDSGFSSVSYTDGDGATASQEATFSLDLTGITAGMLLDTNTTTHPTYDLVFTDDEGQELGTLTSAAVTPTTAGKPIGTDIAAGFNGKKFTLTGDQGSAELTATDSAGTLTIAAASGDYTQLFSTAPTITAKLKQHGAKPAAVVYDGAKVPTYAKYSMATGAASAAKETVVAYTDGTSEEITPLKFILDRAPYEKEFTNSEDKTVLAGVNTDTNVAGFRLMGSLNPMADWSDGKFSIGAVFDMSGVTTTAYNATEKYTTKDATKVAKNVVVKVGAPSIATANKEIAYTAGSGDNIVIPVKLGGGSKAAKGISKMSLKPAGVTTAVNMTATAYTFNAAEGTITFDATKNKTTFFDKMKSGDNELTITFNDKDATEETVKITLS